MPSTVGHALAGVAVAWTADLLPGARPQSAAMSAPRFERAGGPLTLTCAALASLADADLLFGVHRTTSHSVGALALVTIVAAAVTEWVTRKAGRRRELPSAQVRRKTPFDSTQGLERVDRPDATRSRSDTDSSAGRSVLRITLTCAAAYASHLLLDWLAIDRNPPSGIQLLWPFTDRWFVSGWDLFPQVQRFHFLSAAAIRINLIAVTWESAALLPILATVWFARRRRTSLA